MSLIRTRTLPAGTVLYHGTSQTDFDETEDNLSGATWVSDSVEVAEYFARRNQQPGCKPRVLTLRLAEPIELCLLESAADAEQLGEEHGIDFGGVEAMRDSVEASSIEGWIIPNNYPTGADILISNPSCLDYVATRLLDAPAPTPKPAKSRMRP